MEDIPASCCMGRTCHHKTASSAPCSNSLESLTSIASSLPGFSCLFTLQASSGFSLSWSVEKTLSTYGVITGFGGMAMAKTCAFKAHQIPAGVITDVCIALPGGRMLGCCVGCQQTGWT